MADRSLISPNYPVNFVTNQVCGKLLTSVYKGMLMWVAYGTECCPRVQVYEWLMGLSVALM